jgi:hypothetical protein
MKSDNGWGNPRVLYFMYEPMRVTMSCPIFMRHMVSTIYPSKLQPEEFWKVISPHKKEKIATAWVVDHKEKLLTDWKNIAISAISTLTKSGLDFSD